MTLTGGVQRGTTATTITGGHASGGWVAVQTVDRSKFVAGGHYVFIVSGRFGNVVIGGGQAFDKTVVEVCLGDDQGPHYWTVSRLEIRDGWTRLADIGTPFFYVRAIAADISVPADPNYGRSWPGGRDVVVWARVWLNGDPFVSVSAKVSDVHVLWWDLDALGAGRYQIEGADFTTPLNNPPSTSAWAQHWAATNALPGSAGEEWLAFWQVQYRPNKPASAGGNLAAGFRFVSYNPFPTIDTVYVGGHRWGNAARGTRFATMNQGCFAGFTRPAGANFALGVEGRDTYPDAAYRTFVHRVRMFAVRVGDQYDHRRQEAATYPRMTATLFGAVNAFWPWEPTPTITQPTQYVTLWHAIPRHPGRVEAFGPFVIDNTSFPTVLYDQSTLMPLQREDVGEGTSRIAVADRPLGGKGGAAVRWQLLLFPTIGAGQLPQNYDCVELQVVGFGFEDDPSNVETTLPALPSAVVIQPGYEALGVSSLPDIPVIPDSAIELELTGEHVHRFRTDTGYVRTWGRFIGPRTRWRLRWGGISRSDVDALLSFFASNTAFRWQPPTLGETAAFATVTRPEARDTSGAGKYYTLDLEAVELVNVGP